MKIVCFGDSLTRGVSYLKGRARIIKDNYPTFLQRFFALDQEEMIVVNKGVFNDNSSLLINRLEKDVLLENPNYVLINIGGNDCNFKWDEVAEFPESVHEPIVPVAEYINNIKNIIQKVKEYNITPIILTLPPLDPVRYYEFIASKYGHAVSHWISRCGGIEHWHGIYNRQLTKLIEQLHVPFIDVRTNLKKSGDLSEFISDDGIHLNAAGYREMSKIIYQHLSNGKGLAN